MTWAASAVDLATAVAVFNRLEVEYSTATTGTNATINAAKSTIDGTRASAAVSALDGLRREASALLDRSTVRGVLDPLVQELVVQGAAEPDVSADADANFRRVFDYMIDNSQTVNSREFTMGTPAAGGGNVGTATVRRLTTDEESEPMEGWWADLYTLECYEDYLATGRDHVANWRLFGRPAQVDNVGFGNSGVFQEGIPQLTDLNSAGAVANASFDNGTFSGATITTLTNWTIAGSNVETNTTATYVAFDTTNGGTPRSIRFIGNDTVSQELQTEAGLRLDDDTPYEVGVWVYRRDTCDGTFTIRLADGLSGGVSRAVTVTTLSDNAFTYVPLLSSLNQNAWPKNFRADDLTLSFDLASRTTGSLYLDTVIFSPLTRVGFFGQGPAGRGTLGTYLAVIAGRTQTIKEDVHTWTDTEATRAVVQYGAGEHLARYGYLPSATAGAETVADV